MRRNRLAELTEYAEFNRSIKLFLDHSAEKEDAPGILKNFAASLTPEKNQALDQKFLSVRHFSLYLSSPTDNPRRPAVWSLPALIPLLPNPDRKSVV